MRLSREKANMSQEELAARLQLLGHNVGQKAISRMETGIRVIPDYEILLLAEALNVDPLWLLGAKKEDT